MKNFNPKNCGFIERNFDGEQEYVLIKNYKVIGKLWHINYAHGLNIDWSVFQVIHCIDNTTKQNLIYSGRIPNNKFAKELFANLFY